MNLFTINNDKELFEYIRKVDLKNTPTIHNVLSEYNFDFINYKDFEKEYLLSENNLTIDSRSEKEFQTTKIFDSVNFPVLNNIERHNVGLIYKKYSQEAAFYLALEYAKPKEALLDKFLKKNSAKDKNIIIYCWRGGGRSKYLGKMLKDLGYNPKILIGGIKSFRKKVIEFFSIQKFPYRLIEISGLTGTGKSELLNLVKTDYPVIDLELSARHYSSLFGNIPYKIRNFQPVANQSSFENNIYNDIQRNLKNLGEINTFLIESESKKIGDFFIPACLNNEMINAESIKINCDIEFRVDRIIRDYFGDDYDGFGDVLGLFKKKEKFFRKELSNKLYEYLLNQLTSGEIREFVRTMLIEYYDKKYKDKGKKEILDLNSNDMTNTANSLLDFLRNNREK